MGYEVFTGIDALIDKFLKRKYSFHEAGDLQGNMMKCLDLYHSQDIEVLVKKYMPKQDMTLKKDQY